MPYRYPVSTIINNFILQYLILIARPEKKSKRKVKSAELRSILSPSALENHPAAAQCRNQ